VVATEGSSYPITQKYNQYLTVNLNPALTHRTPQSEAVVDLICCVHLR